MAHELPMQVSVAMYDKKLSICLTVLLAVLLSTVRSPRGEETAVGPFRLAAASIVADDDTFSISPLSVFLTETILQMDVPATKHDLLPLCKSILALKKKMREVRSESSAAWRMNTIVLARGLDEIGFANEALGLYWRVARSGPDLPWGGVAVRSIVAYAAVHNDTVVLDSMAGQWEFDTLDPEQGARTARSLFAALYVRGLRGSLSRLLSAPGAERVEPYTSFFQGLMRFDRGEFVAARRDLAKALTGTQLDAPASMRIATMLRLADANWALREDEKAERQFEIIAGLRSPFVRAWARFMLGAIELRRGDRQGATAHFEAVCELREKVDVFDGTCLLKEATLVGTSRAKKKK